MNFFFSVWFLLFNAFLFNSKDLLLVVLFNMPSVTLFVSLVLFEITPLNLFCRMCLHVCEKKLDPYWMHQDIIEIGLDLVVVIMNYSKEYITFWLLFDSPDFVKHKIVFKTFFSKKTYSSLKAINLIM